MLLDFNYTPDQWSAVRQALISTRVDGVPESMVNVIGVMLTTTQED